MNKLQKTIAAGAVIVAAMVSFAFKTAPKTTQTWGVLSSDATYYYLAENITGQTIGFDYKCTTKTDSQCTVTLDDANIVQYSPGLYRILKTQATVVVGSAQFNTNP